MYTGSNENEPFVETPKPPKPNFLRRTFAGNFIDLQDLPLSLKILTIAGYLAVFGLLFFTLLVELAGVAMLATFGIPLLVAPMSWARLMRWEIPPPGQLVTFLGRSLGLFICVVAAYAFKAAATPRAQPFFFELMLWLFVGMIGLHVYGAIKKPQPITETIEIGLWVVLLLVTLAFYPMV